MRSVLLMALVTICAAGALSSKAQGGQPTSRIGWAGVTISLPSGWHSLSLAVPPAVPIEVDPVARIVAASGPVSFGNHGCGEFPYAFPSTAVAVVVLEWRHRSKGVFPRRPARFTSKKLPIQAPPAVECFNGPAGSAEFIDNGRRFDAFLLLGRRASPRLADRARAVLDTLTVATSVRLAPSGIGAVRFGLSETRAVAGLTALFGAPTARGINTACGPRFSEVEWGDLVAEFRAKRFSGFRYLEGGYPLTTPGSPPPPRSKAVLPRLATATGITLGSTFAQLRVAYESRRRVGADTWRSANGLVFVAMPSSNRIVEIKRSTCGDF